MKGKKGGALRSIRLLPSPPPTSRVQGRPAGGGLCSPRGFENGFLKVAYLGRVSA